MKETEMLDELKSRFDLEGRIQRDGRIWVTIDKRDLIELCVKLDESGFTHLSAISATDWPEDEEFELTYHVWSYSEDVLITVKTSMERGDPIIDSVVPIWRENAQIHEREIHELFGIDFEGNDDLEPLFLEDWNGPPPFRKDFNWREYVQDEFYDEEDERESVYFD